MVPYLFTVSVCCLLLVDCDVLIVVVCRLSLCAFNVVFVACRWSLCAVGCCCVMFVVRWLSLVVV